MASTNQTTHYDLSQYVASDKPTYLVDYNGDMSKIDAGIYGADSLARTNEASIGTLSNLDTTVKSDLVSAINEVNTQVGTNTGNISTNTQDNSANTTAIGVLANLSTTVKSDLVSATNEVNSKVGNTANLETTVKTDTVSAINEVNTIINNFNLNHFYNYTTSDVSITGATCDSCDISLAMNDDGSLAKIYGTISFENITQNGTSAYIQTPLRPSQDIVINGGMLVSIRPNERVTMKTYKILTDGRIQFDNIRWYYSTSDEEVYNCINSLIFIKDFGDVPTPTP